MRRRLIYHESSLLGLGLGFPLQPEIAQWVQGFAFFVENAAERAAGVGAAAWFKRDGNLRIGFVDTSGLCLQRGDVAPALFERRALSGADEEGEVRDEGERDEEARLDRPNRFAGAVLG